MGSGMDGYRDEWMSCVRVGFGPVMDCVYSDKSNARLGIAHVQQAICSFSLLVLSCVKSGRQHRECVCVYYF